MTSLEAQSLELPGEFIVWKLQDQRINYLLQLHLYYVFVLIEFVAGAICNYILSYVLELTPLHGKIYC